MSIPTEFQQQPAPDRDRLLAPRQLTERWPVSIQTLANWRCQGLGPEFIKMGGRIFYRLSAIIEYEQRNTFSSVNETRSDDPGSAKGAPNRERKRRKRRNRSRGR